MGILDSMKKVLDVAQPIRKSGPAVSKVLAPPKPAAAPGATGPTVPPVMKTPTGELKIKPMPKE